MGGRGARAGGGGERGWGTAGALGGRGGAAGGESTRARIHKGMLSRIRATPHMRARTRIHARGLP